MDQKNTVITVVLVLIVLALGILWFTNNSTTPAPEVPVVATTTPIVATPDTTGTPTLAEAAYTQTRVKENGSYVTLVSYTDEGFVPAIVYINVGETVRFTNKATGSMRVATNEFQSVPLYAGFGQEKSVGKNGSYSFVFTLRGVWGYNNMNATPRVYGVVYVR